MEMSMYQDTDNGKTQQLKRNNMYLDFASGNTKHQKFQSMLASPDLNMLKLASPELEKMLVAQNGMMTTTPTPTQFVYPKYVTDEQEAYARGFVEALAELHSAPGAPGAPAASNDTMNPVGASDNNTKDSNNTSTYSTLMPMSTTSISATSSHSMMTSAATTLVNMNGNAGYPRRHQYIPSSLALPHHAKPIASSTIPSSTAYGTVHVKEEPSASMIDQTVPRSPATSSRITDSPPLSPNSSVAYNDDGQFDGLPVDMEAQEKIKLERKRARNRIAARKCRTRKLERISRLEEKVSDLKTRNNELQQTAASLGEQVMQLKQQIMEHMKSGCQIMMPDMRNTLGGL